MTCYEMLDFGQLTIPERGRGPGHVIRFRILHPLNFSELAEDRIVKFCAPVGPRSNSLVVTNCNASGRSQGHVTS